MTTAHTSAPARRSSARYLRAQILTVRARLQKSRRIAEIRALQGLLTRLEHELAAETQHHIEEMDHV